MGWQANKSSVVDDLYFLRKGEGFTPVRFYDRPDLPDLLGGRMGQYEIALICFLDAIERLQAEPLRTSLLVAYGLLEGYTGFSTVRQRRDKYSQQVGRKYDTIQHWEDVAIEQLAEILIASAMESRYN